MCWAYNRQYGTQLLCAMPTNLYGPGDNYDLATSHVLPKMIRRFHETKVRGDKTVTLWGTGAPRREFLFSDDMAAACVHLMDTPKAGMASLVKNETPPLINVGCGTDLAIGQLAELVRKIVGTNAVMEWDTSKPDGTPHKLLDVGKLAALGWKQAIGLEDGIRTSNRSGVVGVSVRSNLG